MCWNPLEFPYFGGIPMDSNEGYLPLVWQTLSKCLHSDLLSARCIYDMRYLGKLNDACLISCQRHFILLPGIFHIHFISCPRLFHNQPGRFFILHFISCPRISHNQPGRFFISISLLTPGYFITTQADFSLFSSLLAPGYFITSQADFSLFV